MQQPVEQRAVRRLRRSRRGSRATTLGASSQPHSGVRNGATVELLEHDVGVAAGAAPRCPGRPNPAEVLALTTVTRCPASVQSPAYGRAPAWPG